MVVRVWLSLQKEKRGSVACRDVWMFAPMKLLDWMPPPHHTFLSLITKYLIGCPPPFRDQAEAWGHRPPVFFAHHCRGVRDVNANAVGKCCMYGIDLVKHRTLPHGLRHDGYVVLATSYID